MVFIEYVNGIWQAAEWADSKLAEAQRRNPAELFVSLEVQPRVGDRRGSLRCEMRTWNPHDLSAVVPPHLSRGRVDAEPDRQPNLF